MTDPWKLQNPTADEPCGVVDVEAQFPELVHYGCRECRRIVRELLSARVQKPRPDTSEQLPLFKVHSRRKLPNPGLPKGVGRRRSWA
jgi:hypothetical protein